MKKSLLLIFVSIPIISYYNCFSQSLNSSLANLSTDVAQVYISPLISGYGSDMNSGWVQRVPEAKKIDFHFSAGIVFMGSLMGNANKHFSQSSNIILSSQQADMLTAAYNSQPQLKQFLMNHLTKNPIPVTVSGATIIGSKNDTVNFYVSPSTYYYNGQPLTLPGQRFNIGFGGILDNLNVFTMFAPQITIGTLLGTEVTFRIVPKSFFAGSNLNGSYCYGVGIQHNPLSYFNHPPLFDLSLGVFYQAKH